MAKRKVSSVSGGFVHQSEKAPKKAKIVGLNDLNWREVKLDGHLDDYEGFMGLEEVDEVEVLKNGDVISFQVTEQDMSDRKISNDQAEGVKDHEAEEDDEDQSWCGFSDTEAGSNSAPSEAASEHQSHAPKNNNASLTLSNSFQRLTELDTEQQQHEDADEHMQRKSNQEDSQMDGWRELDLSPDLEMALKGLKFSNPTPIQIAAIPSILSGRDVIAKAETGSGKTVAFAIPILERFLQRPSPTSTSTSRGAWALILSPTRELAHQIGQHILNLCEHGTFDKPQIAIVTGGMAVQKQERLLPIADIVIATPGRLNDLLNSDQEVILKRLQNIKYLVLDEADRLIGGSRIFSDYPEMQSLLLALDRKHDQDRNRKPVKRQMLLFSATFDRVLSIALGHNRFQQISHSRYQEQSLDWLTKNLSFQQNQTPEWIDVNQDNRLAKGVVEGFVQCGNMEKDLYLYTVLLLHARTRTLVFLNSISAVRRVTPYLQNLNLPAQALHSNMLQKARLTAIERFSKTESSILISTDVAARGLDIPAVELVIHYHLPRTAEMYVHRSGRTARADHAGASIILCCPEEHGAFNRLTSKVHELKKRSQKRPIQLLDIDPQVVGRLKPRSVVAKRIADVGLAKEKPSTADKFLREAAQELGVDYDSEELENGANGRQGRGNARRKKKRDDQQVSKKQLATWRAELKHLLAQRVNVGVSAKYLAQGMVDVDAILRQEKSDFLGTAKPINLVQ